ncbi:BZ3500_MvSof-1268-A1-R1_Chr1-1g01034 [Microbotryum saponariae]|uniref:BZ3500_MvSof-1268-A1-R1_Chr1-1g01034 protein n=1 Tax=Microbotryum saponariae TaxID=289078 RepID=A0A2X0MBN9_9BASI|nr:BZ3500_MvSof-1268-A1-R1_Chr1-1g01034 [Microbotryum saponariae]SCZ93242.1 BZ3501_MvSof-1269-A2-R1_Chr1-1g00631 [Microbotryum saponariae]
MDPTTGLPLAFGKIAPQQKQVADRSKLDATKRVDTDEHTPTASTSKATLIEDDSDNEPLDDDERDNARQAREERRDQPRDEDEDEDDDEHDRRHKYVISRGPAMPPPEPVGDLPVSHEAILKDHQKAVSALSMDPAGGRIVSGSYDYDVKLWDFAGMTAAFKPFRSFEPKTGHQVRARSRAQAASTTHTDLWNILQQVHDVQFSPSGANLLVATGTNQAKLYDRDGLEVAEFNKGDMYIRDLRHTDGHVAALTSLAWNRIKPTQFVTASEDSTLRIWDVANRRKSTNVIVVKSKERGGRSKVTSCAWSQDGKTIAASCEDGALHMWAANSNFARPNASSESAHTKGTTTSCVLFSSDGRQLASRGGDSTVKLWDCRQFRKPLFTATDLPSANPETSLCFSPDEKYLLTGTSGAHAGVLEGSAEQERAREAGAGTRGTGGKVVVLNREGLTNYKTIELSPFSVIRVLWHPKINQIVTSSSDGSIHVLYSPETSVRGATMALLRAPRKKAVDDYSSAADLVGSRPIIAPHTLPAFRDDGAHMSANSRGGKRRREKERQDPKKTMKPRKNLVLREQTNVKSHFADVNHIFFSLAVPPVVGPGRGGRVGASATQHVVQGLVRDNLREQDPREALLKYATASVEENEWTAAWTKNQPKPVFDLRPDTDDEDDDPKKKGKAMGF